MEWIDTLVQGVLLGGLYALFAVGLSLSFGVMRMVNLAHGDFIIGSAYVALVVVEMSNLHPFLGGILVVPLMALIGYALQRGLLNRVMGSDIMPPLLVTFGLSVILQNVLLLIFSADSKGLDAGFLQTESLRLSDSLAIGWLPLLTLGCAVAVIAGLQYLFGHTEMGRAFRATSDDQDTAKLMGIDTRHVFALAMAIALAVVAIAAVLLAVRTTFNPSVGPSRLLFAFESVIIGGLGSIWGTLVGGMVLGVSQTIGFRLDPGWGVLMGHLAFLVTLLVRPNGLFPRTKGH